ncbi:MAG TPA: site-specific integrase, partial [Solirubrobacterales bacterium]
MATRAKGEVLRRRWKRGSGYAIRFFAYGRREYLTLGFEADGWTRERAEVELENVMADVRRGIWVPPPRRDGHRPGGAGVEERPRPDGTETFASFAAWLLEARRGQHSERHEQYLRWGLMHLTPYFAEWELRRIDVEAVDDYRARKVAESESLRRAAERGTPRLDDNGRPRRPLGASTINKTIDVLSWVLGFAVEYKRIPDNPAQGRRRRLPEPRRRPVHLDSAEQIEALLDAAAELDREMRTKLAERRALVATMVLAGPRAIEVGALRWRDVDLANGRITVGRSKTQAGLREITMVPILRDILAAHKAASRHAAADDRVFGGRRRARRDKDNLRARVLGPVFRRADELLAARGQQPLPIGLTPHKLRHTFASVLIAIGEDPASVMNQLGHTDPKFTLRVYTHVMRRGSEERDRLKALVAGEAKGHELSEIHLGWPAFRAPILRVLAEVGGRSTRREVLARLGVEMEERFGTADLEDRRGAPRWHMHADLARRHLCRDGLVRSDSR